ncbi:MAG: hypothetical protein JNK91_08895 [Ferruginibacter sp.]|nr:hypothetical protein [Ferruginibacter sp.]
MIELDFIPPPESATKYTANVHNTGRLGFSIATADHFGISVGKAMQLAVQKGEINPTTVYGLLVDKVDETTSYKVMKAGKYHSVNAKGFFDTVGIDYTGGRVAYIVTETEINGKKFLKFTQKPIKKGKSVTL